jgi:hypothetical protein
MSSDKLYTEILDEFTKAQTREQKIYVLRKYGEPSFRDFLFIALEPKIEFDTPIPRYRLSNEPAGLNYTYLSNEVPKLYRFCKNHPLRPVGLTTEKQQQLLLVILESLHRDEAALLVKMMKKTLDIEYLSQQIVTEAFPQIKFSAPTVEVKPEKKTRGKKWPVI